MDKRPGQKIYEFGEFRLETSSLMLYRNGEALPLVPKAVQTLLALIDRPGRIVSKDELLQAVWPDTAVEESNLFFYLSILRKSLGTRPTGESWIETHRRRGYKFTGEVTVVRETSDEKYAWVVDGRDPSPANIRTQSGQHYILKTWPSDQIEFAEVEPTEITNGNAPAWAADVPKVEKNAQQDTRESYRTRIVVVAAVAAFVTLIGAAYFVFRLSNYEATNLNQQISTVPLTNGVDVNNPTISPDGKKLVYDTFDGEHSRIFVQQVGQLSALEILPATTLRIGYKTFSPDGGLIYYSARERIDDPISLYRMSVLGGAATKVLTGMFEHSAISFSPDASEFVYSRYEDDTKRISLSIAKTNGGGERELLSIPGEWLAFPAWSPDGKTIAYARTNPNDLPAYISVWLEGIDPYGGEPRRLIDHKLQDCFRIAWTSESDGLVFAGTRAGEDLTSRRQAVWFASLESGKLTRISQEGDRYNFGGLTKSDEAVVVPLKRSAQIWAMDAKGDSRTAEQLTRGSTDGRTGIAPLPDGSVTYMTRNADQWEIWTMNRDGSGQIATFAEKLALEELRATPDGQYLFFNAHNGDIVPQLFRVKTDGTQLTQLTFGDSFRAGDSTSSSDSTSIYYTGVKHSNPTPDVAVYRIPIEGGDPERITGPNVEPQSPYASRDGKYLSYVDVGTSPWRLVIMRLSDSTEQFFDVPNASELNVGAVWTPDSKAIAYIVNDKKASNVWLQPITGGPARRLTDFTTGRIYRIAYSLDGKRLYLSRGHGVNDAFLIRAPLH